MCKIQTHTQSYAQIHFIGSPFKWANIVYNVSKTQANTRKRNIFELIVKENDEKTYRHTCSD